MNQNKKMYAAKIIEADRNQLVMEFRFLSYALYALEPKGLSDTTLEDLRYATDGIHFYYEENRLLKDFLERQKDTSRIYLHSVLHCLYLHPYFAENYENQRLWTLACDLFVLDIVNHIDASKEDPLGEVLDGIKQTTGILSAQNLYSLLEKLLQAGKMDWKEIGRMERAFRVDDHDLWYMPRQERGNHAGEGERSENEGTIQPSYIAGNFTKVMGTWQKAADYAEVELAGVLGRGGLLHGDSAGSLVETIKNIQREGISYEDFLRKFSAIEERMHIDMDSYDYNYYMYGLELYADMPLVEPIEYKEMHTIREFVIAIDTSGSCNTELVRTFLTKTYNILQETIFTDEGLDVHIIQCDADIQNDVAIHSRDDMERYIEELHIYGRGGTDFRPVFQRIEEYQYAGRLKELRGLLYFTDGHGTYPEAPTKYKTAFIFSEDNVSQDIPPWIIKYYIRKDFS